MATNVRKDDMRVMRTNKMLNDAIVTLLKKQSIDKISVVDLCEAANIHRATFYKHYKDKEEFIEHVVSLQLDRLYSEAKTNLTTDDPVANLRVVAEVTIDFVDRNRNLILSNARSGEGSGLLSIIAAVLSRELKHQFGKSERLAADDKYLGVVSHYVAGGLICLFGWWISKDTGISREELIDSIIKLALAGSDAGRQEAQQP